MFSSRTIGLPVISTVARFLELFALGFNENPTLFMLAGVLLSECLALELPWKSCRLPAVAYTYVPASI